MENEIILSVISTCYNHEKYIRYALEGILIQETSFRFEVLIGEDCSTDNSRKILQEYERKYPGRFTIFYREHNFGAVRNYNDLHSRSKGKYEIILETDDFWISPHKLQKEVEYLENNPDCTEVAHRCIMVDDNNVPLGLLYPECHKSFFTLKDFRKGLLPGQNTSIVYRNYYRYDLGFPCDLVSKPEYDIGPGDTRRAFVMASNGKVHCLDEVMSAYRLVTNSGSSFSAKQRHDALAALKCKKFCVDYSISCIPQNKEAVYTAEYIWFRDLTVYCIKRDNVDWAEWKRARRELHYPIRTLISTLGYLVGYFVNMLMNKDRNQVYTKIDVSRDSVILDAFLSHIEKMKF